MQLKLLDTTPERMHPVTAREMFVGRYVDFQEGWLVFESDTERRRLLWTPPESAITNAALASSARKSR